MCLVFKHKCLSIEHFNMCFNECFFSVAIWCLFLKHSVLTAYALTFAQFFSLFNEMHAFSMNSNSFTHPNNYRFY